MVYVFCTRPSDSAKELVTSLEAIRLRRFDGENFWRKNRRIKFEKGDFIICWGDEFPADAIDGVHVLNGGEVGNKYSAAIKLQYSNVPTISVLAGDDQPYDNGNVWLKRRYNHQGGSDLLRPGGSFDYFVKREQITKEFRVHSFQGKSIRAGVKVLRDGFTVAGGPGVEKASDWVRSFDGGWRIKYDEFQSNKALRDIAHKAVKGLGLDFGAVDIGMKSDNSLIVFEVNRAPGLEGGSISAYANAIKRWINDVRGNEGAGAEGAPVPQPDQRRATERVPLTADQAAVLAAPGTAAATAAAAPRNAQRAATPIWEHFGYTAEQWRGLQNRAETIIAAERTRRAAVAAAAAAPRPVR